MEQITKHKPKPEAPISNNDLCGVSKSLFLNGRGFEKTESETTGEGWKYLKPYQVNANGNKQSAYRRRLCWIFRRRDNSTCRVCGSPAHNVHHILARREYPHWKKEYCNLISLCFDCHNLADVNYFPNEYLFSLIPNKNETNN